MPHSNINAIDHISYTAIQMNDESQSTKSTRNKAIKSDIKFQRKSNALKRNIKRRKESLDNTSSDNPLLDNTSQD